MRPVRRFGSPSTGRGARGRRIATVAALVVGVVLGVMIVALQTGSETGLLDLRIYRGAAEAVAEGGSAYSFEEPTFGLGSTYPPLFTVGMLALAWIDVHALEVLWTVVGLCLWFATTFVIVARVQHRSCGLRAAWRREPGLLLEAGLFWLASLPTAPVWNTLNQGQINFVVWALIVADLAWQRRRRWQGALIGLASAIKLTPAVFAVALVLGGRRRAGARAAVAFIAATVLGAVVLWADSVTYWTQLVFDSSRVGSLGASENNSVAGSLVRVGVPGQIALGAGVLVGAVLLLVARPTLRRAFDSGDVAWIALVVGSIGALVSPISWTHHLVFVTFLLPWTWHEPDVRRHHRIAALILMELVLVDPVGFGRSATTSLVRSIAMAALAVTLIALGPRRPVGVGDPAPSPV